MHTIHLEGGAQFEVDKALYDHYVQLIEERRHLKSDVEYLRECMRKQRVEANASAEMSEEDKMLLFRVTAERDAYRAVIEESLRRGIES